MASRRSKAFTPATATKASTQPSKAARAVMTAPAATAAAGSAANGTPLKILLVATEAVPFAKEGGVADVMGSLPKELAALGHDVRLFLPRYGAIDPERWQLRYTEVARSFPFGASYETVYIFETALPDATVPVYLLEHEGLFGRHKQRLYLVQDERDDQPRFILSGRGL